MEITDAILKAKENEEIRKIISEKGFFCSGFVTLEPDEGIEKWNLNFYNPETGKITSVLVSEKDVEIGVTDKPLRKRVYEPDESKIRIGSREVLEKAKEEFKKYGETISKIVLSYQKRKKEFWNVLFVTKTGLIVNVSIDPQTGKVTKSKIISIFRNYKR